VDRLDSEIIYDRDFDYDYFGFKVSTLTAAANNCQAARLLLLAPCQGSKQAIGCAV